MGSGIRSLDNNNRYHLILRDYYQQMLEQHLTFDFDKLKQGLKDIDPNVDGKSSAKLTDKELCDHQEFIIRHFAQYGITCKIVEEEFERMKKLARI